MDQARGIVMISEWTENGGGNTEVDERDGGRKEVTEGGRRLTKETEVDRC